MNDYIAPVDEWCVLEVGDPWQLLFLAQGTHLATSQPYTIYLEREEACAAIKAQFPDFDCEEPV